MEFNSKIYKEYSNQYKKSPNQDHLQQLTDYLDRCGYKMPDPYYKYDCADKKTWKFLDGRFFKDKISKRMCYRQRLNPDFKYK